MRYISHIYRYLTTLLLLLCGVSVAAAQEDTIPFGPSDPSTPMAEECINYQWPPVMVPCPEVQIKQKHDHTPYKHYQAQGWDTAVTCHERGLELTCMTFLPNRYFTGQYFVDTIPYDPPDPTFARGTKMPVTTDDDFASDTMAIPFPFYFFGQKKTSFVLGANGLITFNASSAGKYCPWKYTASLPWPDNKAGAPKGLDCTLNHMRDAIYGIYEDTHPIAAYLTGDQGIYYGIQGEEPCRKIICSWNGVPVFPGVRNRSNRCTYQIVCYEGSNIIEVHVKHRGMNAAWQGHGLIGIQNATGTNIGPGPQGDPTAHIDTGYAAYYPENCNMLTETLDSIAFRFSPAGEPFADGYWYRIGTDANGEDTLIALPEGEVNQDEHGYQLPLGLASTACNSYSRAWVTPQETSRYVYRLRYTDANNDRHIYDDTIKIGMDTLHALTLRPADSLAGDTVLNLCSGVNANLMIEYPPLQDTVETYLEIWRRRNGADIALPDTLLRLGELYVDDVASMKRIPAILVSDSTATHLRPGEIDSVYIKFTAIFTSGAECQQAARMLVRFFPSYDTIEYDTICQGESYHWHIDGQDYTTTTTAPHRTLPTYQNCDSTIHLHLQVNPTSDTVEHIEDCTPVTWHNGRTYTESNSASAGTDTIHRRNRWDCDSLVHLELIITPMTTRIEADLEHFDLDHLEVMLTDASTGNTSREWTLPDGSHRTEAVIYYTIPYEKDSATFTLTAKSPYGCQGTASLTLPLYKDVIWVPNTFTPANPTSDANGRFATVSRYLLRQETLIYNRRGELVFSCEEIDCPWDGKDLNGNPCPQGAYVYIVRYVTQFEPQETKVLKGTVTVVR